MTGISASTMASITPQPLAAALQLDRLGAGPDQDGGVADGVVAGRVVAHPRQVADHERARAPRRSRRRRPRLHRRGVVGHVVHGHVQRVVVAQDHHGERVADEDQVDAGGVRLPGAGRVVGGHHDQRIASVPDLATSGWRERSVCASAQNLLLRPAPRWLPAVGPKVAGSVALHPGLASATPLRSTACRRPSIPSRDRRMRVVRGAGRRPGARPPRLRDPRGVGHRRRRWTCWTRSSAGASPAAASYPHQPVGRERAKRANRGHSSVSGPKRRRPSRAPRVRR